MTTQLRPAGVGVPAPAPSRRLADLGFLAGPGLPDRPGPVYLLVALRDLPTLRHDDPAAVEYWVTQRGRGVRASLTRFTPLPVDRTSSWGMIRLYDRVSVTHEYLTFGGHVSAVEVDGATIAVFTSPVPMLRRGGQFQLWDEGTDVLAAVFARVPAIDVQPNLQKRLAAADPYIRYAAFLADVVRRYRARPELRSLDPRMWTLLRAEESLMRRVHPDAWQAGATILADTRRRVE